MTRRGQRGSALVLVPALALVVVGLGGGLLDGAAAFAAQRTLVTDSQAAAASAAGAAIDLDALHRTGALRVDRALAASVIRRLLVPAHPQARFRWGIRGRALWLVVTEPAPVVVGAWALGGPTKVSARASARLELAGGAS